MSEHHEQDPFLDFEFITADEHEIYQIVTMASELLEACPEKYLSQYGLLSHHAYLVFESETTSTSKSSVKVSLRHLTKDEPHIKVESSPDDTVAVSFDETLSPDEIQSQVNDMAASLLNGPKQEHPNIAPLLGYFVHVAQIFAGKDFDPQATAFSPQGDSVPDLIRAVVTDKTNYAIASRERQLYLPDGSYWMIHSSEYIGPDASDAITPGIQIDICDKDGNLQLSILIDEDEAMVHIPGLNDDEDDVEVEDEELLAEFLTQLGAGALGKAKAEEVITTLQYWLNKGLDSPRG